jgi:hypothetical protein
MDLQDALIYFGLSSITEVSIAELKAIYRRLAKQKHPDQGGTNTEFVNLRKAFVLLKNELEKVGPKNEKTTIVTQELAELNKDELIARYYKDTEKLQNQLQVYEKSVADQQIILSNLKEKVQNLVENFNKEKENLQNSVKQEIKDLEKKLNRETFWRRVFFFWPTISKEEFWLEYNNKIQYYTNLNTDLDATFFKSMLSTYGEGLNGMQKNIPQNVTTKK